MTILIGIDQYGQHYNDLGKFPRKELSKRLYNTHVQKMYVDKKDGSTKHIGYIIGGLWITLYTMKPWEQEA